MSDDMVRAFIAVFPPASVVAALDAAIAPVRSRGDGVAWVAAANLHITLRFLGKIAPGQVEAVRRALIAAAGAASTSAAPFAVATAGPGAFPGPACPRVLWIGAREGAVELVALAARVEKALVREGFPPAEKPFTPHLTVGRVRAVGAVVAPSALAAAARFLALSISSQRFEVGAIALVASTLAPDGARYEMIATAALGGAAG